MARNPDYNFSDSQTGILLEEEIEITHPTLVDQALTTWNTILLPDNQIRFIEQFDPSGSEYSKQYRQEFGEWGTEIYIIYFDLVAGDQYLIKKGQRVSFNQLSMFENTLYNPNSIYQDNIKCIIKSLSKYAGLNKGSNGVDCGCLEAFCIAF